MTDKLQFALTISGSPSQNILCLCDDRTGQVVPGQVACTTESSVERTTTKVILELHNLPWHSPPEAKRVISDPIAVLADALEGVDWTGTGSVIQGEIEKAEAVAALHEIGTSLDAVVFALKDIVALTEPQQTVNRIAREALEKLP